MRCACIDVGSNTTRLLVAEGIPGGMRDLRNERVFTLIGRSMAGDGRIPEQKIAEAATAVAWQAEMARGLGVERVRAVATAAIRGATNAAELAAAVEERASVPLDVLTGEEEARLAFSGAAHVLGGTGSLAVVDVGGGSTEVAFGSVEEGVQLVRSVPVGTSLLAERHFSSDPPRPEDVDRSREDASAAFAQLETSPVDRAVAVGGSASSLKHLAGGELGARELQTALDLLLDESAWDVACRFELDPERVRLLPAGLVILGEIAGRLDRPLQVCKGGLREGVILELLRA